MFVCMRTTIVLDDRLLDDAKKFAAARSRTLSDLIADALRAAMTRTSSPASTSPFELVTFGGEGLNPPYTWERLSDALLDQEVEGLRRHPLAPRK